MKVVELVKDDLKNDVNWNRLAHLGIKGARALPRASARYAIDKVPIVGWLPRYNYRWILNDVVAGLTIGLMIIPQGLAYAKLATIPVEYGLMSSWFPAVLYAFMGTSKELSTGPTSLIGLLTSEIIEGLKNDPENYTPSQIASGVALMMGVYGMILGFLKLGFLLEFISNPILSGFITAMAVLIILNQMGSLLGTTLGDGTAAQIHDTFSELPNANGYACAIGFTAILLLTILDHAYKKWNKSKILWFLSITRSFICLVLYTGVGYAVNKNRGDPDNFLFAVAEVQADGQEAPAFPRGSLIGKVASRSIAVFIGSAVEHTAIARAFGVRNNYVTDQSQELAYYGIANFFNSFFHAMGVGGAMSRTAVNSSCNVKSPLNGLVTMAAVLISIYFLTGVLYWVPKSALAAIIICAVWPLISSPAVFYRYWKSSLADWVAAMLTLWVALFESMEIGLAVGVGFNIVYIVLRTVFIRVRAIGAEDATSELAASMENARRGVPPSGVPADTHVFRLGESIYSANAYSCCSTVIDVVKTYHAPSHASTASSEAERNWSVVGEKRIARLRKEANIGEHTTLPPIALIVLDFTRANHIDVTAVMQLKTMKAEVTKYAGGADAIELRFVGMSPYVRERFERMAWPLKDGSMLPGDDDSGNSVTKVYPDVASALAAPRRGEFGSEEVDLKVEDSEYGKPTSTHTEKA